MVGSEASAVTSVKSLSGLYGSYGLIATAIAMAPESPRNST